MAVALSSRQRQFLKGLAHHLQPIVQLGVGGLSEATLAAAQTALPDHELIKVKFGKNFPQDTQEAAEALAIQLNAGLCQVIGRIAVYYRPSPIREKRKLELPA